MYPTQVLIDRKGRVVGKFYPTDKYGDSSLNTTEGFPVSNPFCS
jgi:hypothetical protein